MNLLNELKFITYNPNIGYSKLGTLAKLCDYYLYNPLVPEDVIFRQCKDNILSNEKLIENKEAYVFMSEYLDSMEKNKFYVLLFSHLKYENDEFAINNAADLVVFFQNNDPLGRQIRANVEKVDAERYNSSNDEHTL